MNDVTDWIDRCAAALEGRRCMRDEGHKNEHRFEGIKGKTCTCMLRWYPNRCKAHPECNQ